MSKDTTSTSIPSNTEDTPLSRTRSTSLSEQSDTPKQYKRKSELQKLTQDTSDLDINVLNTGGRLLRSQKTLLHPTDDVDPQLIQQQFEQERIIDAEISFRPFRAGQTTQDKHHPTRQDFEYIYQNIDDVECQKWAFELEPWLDFIKKDHITNDPSIPLLDKEGNEYPDITFSLDNLLQLPTNKKYLKRKQKHKTHETPRGTTGPSSSQQHSDPTSPDLGSSSGSSSSFVILPNQNALGLAPLNISDLDFPPSTGGTPNNTPGTNTPAGTPPPTPSPLDSDSVSDLDMASLKERSIFVPTEKFDGKNKALTKQHWQRFEDFCNQQK